MIHDWRFILAERDGTEVGELWNPGDLDLVVPLVGGKGGAALTTSIGLEHPMADVIIGDPADQTTRINKLLKVYRDGERMLVGDLWTGEEAGDDGTERLSIAAMGPLHARINSRMAGLTSAGFSQGSAVAQLDLGVIMRTVLDSLNGSADTGVRKGTHSASINGFVEKVYAKPVGELFVELSQQLGGPDFEIDPVEPVVDGAGAGTFAGAGVKIAELNTALAIGQSQPKAVFEYGTGKRNVKSYRRPFDRSGQGTIFWHQAPGFPDSVAAGITPIMQQTSATALAAWGRMDAVVTADIQPPLMRALLLLENARIRGNPRETFFFTPVPDSDVTFGEHYGLGDLVEARIVDRRGRRRFDGEVRVYGAHFTRDQLGRESIELTLINEGNQTA